MGKSLWGYSDLAILEPPRAKACGATQTWEGMDPPMLTSPPY